MSQTPPYFPFYPTDFAASGTVEAMTTEEVGAYILLLCKAWHETPPCSIPDDDRILARWTRLGDDGWTRCRSTVRACFVLRDGRLYNPRLDREWRKLSDRLRKAQESGKRGGQASVKGRLTKPQGSLNHPKPDSDLKTAAAAVADVPTERIGELDHIRNALTGVGFSAGEAIRLSGKPGLTVRTVEWLIDRAREQRATKPKAFIASGINGGWTPDAGPLAAKPASDYKAPRSGVWG